MAKKKRTNTVAAKGEQMDLIDVGPENLKAMKPVARRYKAAQKRRIEALADEVKEKKRMLELIVGAKLKPDEDGVVLFTVDGMTVKATPQDWKLSVKEID